MKKILLFIMCCLLAFSGFSQEKKEEVKSPWTKVSTVSLLFNQAAFNDKWQAGGTSNYAANFGLTHEANYKKNTITWDNRMVILISPVGGLGFSMIRAICSAKSARTT